LKRVNEKYQGKFLARGGKLEWLEGGWSPKRIVIVQFPTMDHALKWYHSPDYAPLIELRKKASHFKMIMVDGV
jgi:uncharacterized protein (DUF1330 family)